MAHCFYARLPLIGSAGKYSPLVEVEPRSWANYSVSIGFRKGKRMRPLISLLTLSIIGMVISQAKAGDVRIAVASNFTAPNSQFTKAASCYCPSLTDTAFTAAYGRAFGIARYGKKTRNHVILTAFA